MLTSIHSRSGETVGNWVGNQLAAGCDTHLQSMGLLPVAYPESGKIGGLLVVQAVGWRLGTFSVAHRKPRTPVYRPEVHVTCFSPTPYLILTASIIHFMFAIFTAGPVDCLQPRTLWWSG